MTFVISDDFDWKIDRFYLLKTNGVDLIFYLKPDSINCLAKFENFEFVRSYNYNYSYTITDGVLTIVYDSKSYPCTCILEIPDYDNDSFDERLKHAISYVGSCEPA